MAAEYLQVTKKTSDYIINYIKHITFSKFYYICIVRWRWNIYK